MYKILAVIAITLLCGCQNVYYLNDENILIGQGRSTEGCYRVECYVKQIIGPQYVANTNYYKPLPQIIEFKILDKAFARKHNINRIKFQELDASIFCGVGEKYELYLDSHLNLISIKLIGEKRRNWTTVPSANISKAISSGNIDK